MSLQTAKTLAKLMDSQFEILGIKFGLDPIFELIPGAGDTVAAILALYILKVGHDLGLPQNKIIHMIVNIIVDFLIGLVPGMGVVATIFYRSNLRNIEIIEDYLEKNRKTDNIEEGVIIDQ